MTRDHSIQRTIHTVAGCVGIWRNEHRNLPMVDKQWDSLREPASPFVYITPPLNDVQVGALDLGDGNQYDQTLDDVYLSKLRTMLQFANQRGPSMGMTRSVLSLNCFIGTDTRNKEVFSSLLRISHCN